MAVGLAAAAAAHQNPQASRRTPMQNGKRSLFHISSSAVHASSGRHSSCGRTLRWAMPIVMAAVLSSYLTYLWLYSGRMTHYAWLDSSSNTPHWAQHRGGSPAAAGQLSASSSSSDGTAATTTTAAAAARGGPQQAALAGSHNKYAPYDAAFQWVKAAGRRMRVALVNEAPYHLEIVAGLLQVLGTMPVDVTWYQSGQATADGTLSPIELIEVTGFTQLLGFLPHMRPSTDTPAPCDFAILVSPEYFEKATKAFLVAAKPVTAVVLAHNGMNKALQNIQAFHPRLHFSALSPHVAAAARHALHIHTHWMLPTFSFHGSKAPCTMDSANASTCMNGFSIQGNFEAARRNYTRLWSQVGRALLSGSIPTEPPSRPFQLHLVGRGDVRTLNMPEFARNHTTVHFNLKFREYYDQLQHSHALLMLLGNINYLIQKMSSTVVSSLMTGVPIIADSQVLASYTFLKPQHIFLMGPQETEMDVMQRVLRLSPAEVFNVRQQVLELQQHLNRRAFAVLQAFMPSVDDIPTAPAVAAA